MENVSSSGILVKVVIFTTFVKVACEATQSLTQERLRLLHNLLISIVKHGKKLQSTIRRELVRTHTLSSWEAPLKFDIAPSHANLDRPFHWSAYIKISWRGCLLMEKLASFPANQPLDIKVLRDVPLRRGAQKSLHDGLMSVAEPGK